METINNRFRLRAFVILAVIVSLLAVQTGSAFAHVIHQSNLNLWKSDGKCLQLVRAEISHGNGHGYGKGEIKFWQRGLKNGVHVDCSVSRSVGAGNLGVKLDLYVKGTYGTGWALCSTRGYKYNSSTTSSLVHAHTYKSTESWDHWPVGRTVKCGRNKEYRTRMLGYVYHGSEWRGGAATSGAVGHKLPT